jgi:sugar/nucleoside kinase (ribokinase family)
MARAILIGSANTETSILLSRNVAIGQKATFSTTAQGFGGSAINWSRWMHAAGVDVDVVCPIGDDPAGEGILNMFAQLGIRVPIEIRNSGETHETAHSFILVNDNSRTVLSSERATSYHLVDINAKVRDFPDFQAVMIGNLPTDHASPGTLKMVLDAVRERGDAFIYSNGRAQFQHERDDLDALLSQIDCFQFSLREAKSIAGQWAKEGSPVALPRAMEVFAERNLNVVVTLGRAGAISLFAKNEALGNRVFFSWPVIPTLSSVFNRPILPSGRYDPTGAGDAFGAGFVACILQELERATGNPLRTWDRSRGTDAIKRALDTGSLLGSWACCGLGGSSICPGGKSSLIGEMVKPPAVTDSREMRDAVNQLYALDRASD